MILTYEKAVNLLQSSGRFYINLGLDRIKKILNLLDNPQNKLKIIHIAGTNGKGSVCSILANILKHAGYKTGLYTSPHLVEYTERIKINDVQISQQDFAQNIEFICNLADKNNIPLTEFEILTVCTFKYFNENKTDIVILETGLGGRYDATNVIEHPLLTIITSISLDHTDRLGDTIEKIAYEKAGITKSDCDVIVANYNLGYEVIKDYAIKKNSNLITVENEVEMDFNQVKIEGRIFEFPLIGLYQKKNLALVLSAINLLKTKGFNISINDLKMGLKTVNWRARLEYIKDKNLIIDGAHNPDAALELKKTLDLYFKNQTRTFIYSTINTKDYTKITEILFNPDDIIYYLEFNHPNAVEYDEFIKNTKLKAVKINKEDIKGILNSEGLKILTGSLYMIGEVLS